MTQIINLYSSDQANGIIASQISAKQNTEISLPDKNKRQDLDSAEENDRLIKEAFPNKILFSVKEVADILGVSYDYIRKAAINGSIACKKYGRRRLIHKNELLHLINKGVN